MAENETTSHCFVANNSSNNNHSVSVGFEKSNDLLRSGVWEIKEDKCIERNDATPLLDGSNKDSVKHNKGEVVTLTSEDSQPPNFEEESNEVTEAVTPNSSDQLLGGKSPEDHKLRHSTGTAEEVGKDNRIEPPVQGKSDEPTEPVPGSSNEPVKQETSDGHTVWLPSTAIKAETEDSEESEDEVGEEERLEEECDAEMNDDSNGGAYHLAEVSYGDENEDSQKAEGQESDSVLGIPLDFPNSFFTLNNEGRQDTVLESSLSQSENDKKPMKYVCDKCDYQTDRKYNLKYHSVTHTEGAFNCSVCRYKTNSRYQLIRHHSIHKNADTYVCSECDYTSTRTASMKEHFRRHTGEKPFSCSECSFKCSSRNSLLKHKRTHTGESPYSCNICGKRFKQSGHLTEHMRQHTGEKPFKCTICDYSCAYRCRINRHMETHSGEKPFPCTVCPFRAKNRATLNLHMRTHTGECIHSCALCEYTCNTASQLRAHAYKHNGQALPFTCAMCQASFNKKSNLVNHLKAHEVNQLLACDLCGMKYISRVKLKEHMTSEHKEQS